MKLVADDHIIEERRGRGVIVGQEQGTKNEVLSLEFSRLFVDDEIVEKSWSQLPNDLLSLIFARLSAGDLFAFRSVCRSWRSVSALPTQHSQIIPPEGNSSHLHAPCLIFSNCRIFDPIHSKHQFMDFPVLHDATICVAKDGWLLMTEDVYGLFFWNPLTQEKVTLPNLPTCSPRSMHFTSPPTSRDWVVMVATTDYIQIDIYTIQCGEEIWKYGGFTVYDWSFELSFCNSIMLKGLYYFLGKDAKLLVHDPLRQKFYFHEAPKPISQQLEANHVQQYMLESNGNLLAVFVGCDGRWVRVCRWNFSKRTWETLESLQQKTLFVSRPLSFCQRASTRGTGNKIYFPWILDGHCLFYSMSTKRYHTFGDGSSFQSFRGKFYLYSTWFN